MVESLLCTSDLVLVFAVEQHSASITAMDVIIGFGNIRLHNFSFYNVHQHSYKTSVIVALVFFIPFSHVLFSVCMLE